MKTLLIGSLALLGLGGTAAAGDGGCQVIGTPIDYAVLPPSMDGPLVILPGFSGNVLPGQQAVILQALADWTNVIEAAGHVLNPYPISFTNGPLGGNTLALANVTWDSSTGTLTGATVTIDNDGSSLFYVDPTPGANEEFDANGNCTAGGCMDLTDLLTVMRHEIGHCLGWTGAYGTTNPLTQTYISGLTFDVNRLNIAMDPAFTSHCDTAVHANDLMTPTIPQELRRPIQMYPAAALVARNIDHELILKFIDYKQTLFQSGTADLPWSTVTDAVTFEPAGRPFLIVPGIYDEAAALTITSAHDVYLARGGSVLIE